MATNIYLQHTSAGGKHLARRSVKQGRKPSGLSKPELVRLYEADEPTFAALKEKLGCLYNRNEIIRDAVHNALSVYTELLKH